MPETEQQDETLSEIVVKEAVGKGLESPLRDSILEAVEESEGTAGSSRLPLAGAVFGVGAALGYLAGRSEEIDLSERSLEELDVEGIEDVEEPEIIESVTGGDDGSDGAKGVTETVTGETDEADDSDSSLLAKLVLGLAVLGAVVVLRRRLSETEDEEWEPIEEFEPATDIGDEDGLEDDADAEMDTEDADAGGESDDRDEANATESDENEE
ncbi:hypothetical protein [Halobiforma nitratireducens]|uniref:MYXO-CTERM domain-containing protein n=1 Tax=Halobiforma nitratireducens JCM 10879 TaxID=1227454 RepID=M0L3B0_9EURY|nr:hypothetical protein [Halobiforma nitratireducens]EMA28057.1 hypothetical protein C446_17589 [Halobiforma nitratireducens JCM 10879]